jgi:hypothetical protein
LSNDAPAVLGRCLFRLARWAQPSYKW